MRLDGVRSTGINLQSMNPTIPEVTPPKDSTPTCAGYTESTAQQTLKELVTLSSDVFPLWLW